MLLDQLRVSGVFVGTLVVVSGDHCENQSERNVYGDHVMADDKMNRLQLIVHGPGVTEKVDDAVRYPHDLAPALLNLAGGDVQWVVSSRH